MYFGTKSHLKSTRNHNTKHSRRNNFLAENKCSSNSRFDDDPNSIFADAPDDTEDGDDDSFGNSLHFGGGFFCETSSGPLPEDVRREIVELGFPDDGYNYLLH